MRPLAQTEIHGTNDDSRLAPPGRGGSRTTSDSRWGETQVSCAVWGVGQTEIRDSVGNVLADGDTVVVVRDLKVKGSPTSIKVGTKVRGIRLVDGVDGHDIDCKCRRVRPDAAQVQRRQEGLSRAPPGNRDHDTQRAIPLPRSS